MNGDSRRRFHGPWRSSAAIPFALPILACAIVFLLRHPLPRAAASTRYWGSLVSAANSVTLIAIPACSALFAWDVASLRRAGILQAPSVRPPWKVVAARCLPSLATAMACLLTAWVIMLPRAAAGPSAGDLAAMASAVLRVPAGLAVGLVLALDCPYWLAPPLTLIILYVWHVYPSAFPVLWIRHLVGWFPEGIPSNQQLAHGAMAASGVFALGWILCAAILLGPKGSIAHHAKQKWPAIMAGVLAILLALCSSIALASPYGAEPTRARTGAMACESTSDAVGHARRMRICVWPEHRPGLAAIGRQASYVADRLEKIGYPVPATVTENTTTSHAWNFMYDPATPDTQSIRAALVEGLHRDNNAGMCTTGDQVSYRDEIALVWLAKATDARNLLDNHQAAADDAYRRLASELSSLPAGRQATWVRTAIKEYARACGTTRDDVR